MRLSQVRRTSILARWGWAGTCISSRRLVDRRGAPCNRLPWVIQSWNWTVIMEKHIHLFFQTQFPEIMQELAWFWNLFAQYSVRPCSLVTARRPLPTTVTWGKFLSQWSKITIFSTQVVQTSPFCHHDDNHNYLSTLSPSWVCRPSHWICGSSTGLREACPHSRRL